MCDIIFVCVSCGMFPTLVVMILLLALLCNAVVNTYMSQAVMSFSLILGSEEHKKVVY